MCTYIVHANEIHFLLTFKLVFLHNKESITLGFELFQGNLFRDTQDDNQ